MQKVFILTSWFAADREGFVAIMQAVDEAVLPLAWNPFHKDGVQLVQAVAAHTGRTVEINEYGMIKPESVGLYSFFSKADQHPQCEFPDNTLSGGMTPIVAPYKRLASPAEPLHIYQLPRKWQELFKSLVFSDVSFKDSHLIQPILALPCRLVSGPTDQALAIDVDGVVRPVPVHFLPKPEARASVVFEEPSAAVRSLNWWERLFSPPPISLAERMLNQTACDIILSSDLTTAYRTVSQAALYLAAGGFLSEANELLRHLWLSQGNYRVRCPKDERAMEMLWHAAGERPAGVPGDKRDVDISELMQRGQLSFDLWKPQLASEGDWPCLEGLDLLRRCLQLSRPKEPKGIRLHLETITRCKNYWLLPGKADELKAISGLEKFIASASNSHAYFYQISTALSAEMAARRGDRARATKLAQLWAQSFSQRPLAPSLPLMASGRYLAPLLVRDKILAQSTGLSKEKVSDYMRALLAAWCTRLENGPRLLYQECSWKQLLTMLGTQIIKARVPRNDLQEPFNEAHWLGAPPARQEAIKDAEMRLGLKLPQDYKDFLMVTNGFPGADMFSPDIAEVENVDYLRKSQPNLFAVLESVPEHNQPCAPENLILISGDISKKSGLVMLFLLPPDKHYDEWRTWFFSAWVSDETPFPSFRHFIEVQFRRLSDRSTNPTTKTDCPDDDQNFQGDLDFSV